MCHWLRHQPAPTTDPGREREAAAIDVQNKIQNHPTLHPLNIQEKHGIASSEKCASNIKPSPLIVYDPQISTSTTFYNKENCKYFMKSTIT